jgi:hypothetical protein
MIQTKEAVVNRRPMHYNGIHHAMTSNDQEDLFRAYQSFACHHTINDADMYENAASIASLSEQKKLFWGLSGCKRAVVRNLKRNGSDNSVSFTSPKNTNAGTLTRHIIDLDTTPLITLEDAINLAYWRETKTLLLYEKLLKAAGLPSIKTLFDYLMETQREHIAYITQQLIDGWEIVSGRPFPGNWFQKSGGTGFSNLPVN